jgi:dimethylsulfoniopropionate demethylase
MNSYIAKSTRVRSTPFTNRIEEYGVQSYTVYNHMLLPASFKGLEEDYDHLKKNVQLWDVSVERQVQIKGPDAALLTQLMTCRDLSQAKDHICYYAPIVDDQGKILNDPLVMKVSSDTWWISIADTDVLLYAKGLAIGQKLDVEISEPNVNPLAVQGPKSFELMKRVFGDEILNLKFFHFKRFLFQDHNFLIARSGWSKQGGFEIYVDNDEKGLELYDALYASGKDLDVRPGCPNLIERIEGGLLSYGNDMNMNDTPFECGLDPFVSFNEKINYLGKSTLQEQKEKGVTRSLVGLKLQINKISLSKTISIFQNEQLIGDLRSACFSPKFQCCLGIAMIDISHQNYSEPLNLVIDGQEITAEITSIPFTK